MKQEALNEIGISGMIGIALLAISGALYFGSIVPSSEKLGTVRAETEKLQASLGTISVSETASRNPQGAARALPSQTELASCLNRLGEAATLDIGRTTYALSEKFGERRLDVSIPAKGTYVAARSFLRHALKQGGRPQLDAIRIDRPSPTDAMVMINIRLSYLIGSP